PQPTPTQSLVLAQQRALHASAPRENTLILGSLGVAATALVGSYAVRAYNRMQAEEAANAPPPDESASKQGQSRWDAHNLFSIPHSRLSGKRHYEGGFEEKMTRREAALVLGVRESAAAERIKAAHRRILMLNHPDKGGSKYMAAKINEAKELLLKDKYD
ncbi:unnamed protein product, partial [Chrysoparadoxa australica]